MGIPARLRLVSPVQQAIHPAHTLPLMRRVGALLNHIAQESLPAHPLLPYWFSLFSPPASLLLRPHFPDNPPPVPDRMLPARGLPQSRRRPPPRPLPRSSLLRCASLESRVLRPPLPSLAHLPHRQSPCGLSHQQQLMHRRCRRMRLPPTGVTRRWLWSSRWRVRAMARVRWEALGRRPRQDNEGPRRGSGRRRACSARLVNGEVGSEEWGAEDEGRRQACDEWWARRRAGAVALPWPSTLLWEGRVAQPPAAFPCWPQAPEITPNYLLVQPPPPPALRSEAGTPTPRPQCPRRQTADDCGGERGGCGGCRDDAKHCCAVGQIRQRAPHDGARDRAHETNRVHHKVLRAVEVRDGNACMGVDLSEMKRSHH